MDDRPVRTRRANRWATSVSPTAGHRRRASRTRRNALPDQSAAGHGTDRRTRSSDEAVSYAPRRQSILPPRDPLVRWQRRRCRDRLPSRGGRARPLARGAANCRLQPRRSGSEHAERRGVDQGQAGASVPGSAAPRLVDARPAGNDPQPGRPPLRGRWIWLRNLARRAQRGGRDPLGAHRSASRIGESNARRRTRAATSGACSSAGGGGRQGAPAICACWLRERRQSVPSSLRRKTGRAGSTGRSCRASPFT